MPRASAGRPVPRGSPVRADARGRRWAGRSAAVLLGLLAVGSVYLLVMPAPATRAVDQGLRSIVPRLASGMAAGPFGVFEGLGGPGTLAALAGALIAGTTLSAWHLRRSRARRALQHRRRWRARRRRAAGHGERLDRVEASRPGPTEAILLVDLIQSTELIAEHGDVVFRDLLRRVEAAFIPIARRWGTRGVDGHGDGLLFCFESAGQAVGALRAMYAQLPAINRAMPRGVEVMFRASLHVGETFTDTRGDRTGLAVLKTVRLGSVMEHLHGRGGGRNSLVASEEARRALASGGIAVTPLGKVELRGFPGTHPVYQVDVRHQ